MNIFLNTPLLIQLFPKISVSHILALNRTGQIIALISTILAIYPEEMRAFMSGVFKVTAYTIKALIMLFGFSYGKDGWEFCWPPEASGEIPDEVVYGNFDYGKQVVAALISILFLAVIYYPEILNVSYNVPARKLDLIAVPFWMIVIWVSASLMYLLSQELTSQLFRNLNAVIIAFAGVLIIMTT